MAFCKIETEYMKLSRQAAGRLCCLQAALLMESQCSCFLEQKQNGAVF